MTNDVDCDDGNAEVHPGAVEACGDGIDNDCDGAVDGADPDCGGGSPACGVGGVALTPFTLSAMLAMNFLVRKRVRHHSKSGQCS